MSRVYDKIAYKSLMPAEREGVLTKQGGKAKNWKRRWFVLNDHVLYYFKDQSGVSLGGFSVADARVLPTPASEAKKPFAFSVITPHRTYNLIADTQTDMEEWIGDMQERSPHGAAQSRDAPEEPDVLLSVKGVVSERCVVTVKAALADLSGVERVNVSMSRQEVGVFGSFDSSQAIGCLEDAGFLASVIKTSS